MPPQNIYGDPPTVLLWADKELNIWKHPVSYELRHVVYYHPCELKVPEATNCSASRTSALPGVQTLRRIKKKIRGVF
ncbi:hypothetical protein FRC14_008018 [Serendipita sp. 396]|nr:hypothetical protein FRC14_008018 [Serendipita sp. 396]KAG8801659.1 hypothetical protein FRC16_011364 [Serendipita sp. 398]KAG8870401.1 hypothetical protein FRC20_011904 [Serendipita sp. 405]